MAHRATIGSAAWSVGGFGHASDLVPEVCDEQHIDLQRFRHNSTLPGSSESSEARGSSDVQPRANNASPGTGYGADTFEDAAGASGNSRSAMTGSEQIAMRDCGGPCAIAPTQEIFGVSPPDAANDSNSQKDCTCISCLRIGKDVLLAFESNRYKCRFPYCHSKIHEYPWFKSWFEHERNHYSQQGKYTCLEQNCKVVTKNFNDLKRHDKAKHCTNPYKEHFPCPESWCKYSGNNGFARKDKLKSHYKNMHEGKLGPCKAGRVIKPATLKPKPQVSNLEGTAGKQKE